MWQWYQHLIDPCGTLVGQDRNPPPPPQSHRNGMHSRNSLAIIPFLLRAEGQHTSYFVTKQSQLNEGGITGPAVQQRRMPRLAEWVPRSLPINFMVPGGHTHCLHLLHNRNSELKSLFVRSAHAKMQGHFYEQRGAKRFERTLK
jgi:hypothetical protein